MPPPEETNRRTGHPAARRTLNGNEGRTILADGVDGADPRAVGELLTCWIGIKLDEVDALVDDARAKVAAIPDMRTLASIVGEQYILLRALELEVAQLRGEVTRLRARKGRAA